MAAVTHENWFDSCVYHSIALRVGEDGSGIKSTDFYSDNLINENEFYLIHILLMYTVLHAHSDKISGRFHIS